jgi:NarL family two-component system response regulator LiaR
MTEPISILIVDDHEVVRKGLRSYLDTLPNFRVIGEASTGEEAIKIVEEYIPDVVLMDLIMPGMDGVETTRRIKKISPRTQVVVLTSFHEDSHIFPALKAGATSYILKDMKMEKLVESLERAVAGEVTLHPLVARRVLQNFQGADPEEQPLFAEGPRFQHPEQTSSCRPDPGCRLCLAKRHCPAGVKHPRPSRLLIASGNTWMIYPENI